MEIASLAYRLGCVNVQWQTPVWNERAIRFYQRLGGKGKEKVRLVFGGEAKDPFLPSERETPNVTMAPTDFNEVSNLVPVESANEISLFSKAVAR